MSQYIVSISIGELQRWLSDDQLSILSHRIVFSRSPIDGNLSAEYFECLFNHLPSFALDDSAGVLFVEIGPPSTWVLDNYHAVCHLKLSEVKRFIPLTEDSRKALGVRWSDVLNFSPAIFQSEFSYFRLTKKSLLARSAGNRFVNIFITSESDFICSDSLYCDSLIRAIMAAELSSFDEIEHAICCHNAALKETWIERLFGDVRKYDKENKLLHLNNVSTHLRSIMILGVLFSTVESTRIITDEIRSVYAKLKEQIKSDDKSLLLVYSNPELTKLTVNFFIDPEGNETISLVSLGLFLRWKQAFFDARSKVNTQLIQDDIRSLIGFVEVDSVKRALWLMGAYLGMDYIAPTYRQLHNSSYPALRFSGNFELPKSIAPWEIIKNAPIANNPNLLSPDPNMHTRTEEITVNEVVRSEHISSIDDACVVQKYQTQISSKKVDDKSIEAPDDRNSEAPSKSTENSISKHDQFDQSTTQLDGRGITPIEASAASDLSPADIKATTAETANNSSTDSSAVEDCLSHSDAPTSNTSGDAPHSGVNNTDTGGSPPLDNKPDPSNTESATQAEANKIKRTSKKINRKSKEGSLLGEKSTSLTGASKQFSEPNGVTKDMF